MMILPPIDPILNNVEKGSVRRLNDLVAEQVGISSKQLTNLMLGHHRPRLGTVQKLRVFLEYVTDQKVSSLFGLRAFSIQNEWVAFLDGIARIREIQTHFPHLVGDIRHLGTLDSKLERLHRKPRVFKTELDQIAIVCIADNISRCELNFKSQRALRGSLAGFRFHVATYLFACLESELLNRDDRSNDHSSWGEYFYQHTKPRSLFIDRLMKRADIMSKNELAQRYSVHSKADLDNRKRHIRRVASGKYAINSSDLKFLSGLAKSEKDEAITYLEYYVARYAQFQKNIILEADSKGLSDALTRFDFCDSYDEYYQYCLNRKQVQHSAAPAGQS